MQEAPMVGMVDMFILCSWNDREVSSEYVQGDISFLLVHLQWITILTSIFLRYSFAHLATKSVFTTEGFQGCILFLSDLKTIEKYAL